MAEEMNLDEINLDEIDLDTIDLSDFGEVDDSVEFPHIKINTKMFKEFLKVAKKICSSGGKDIISKSVCLKYDVESGKVKCYSTDFDVYCEFEIECQNTENILLDPVVIPTDTLIKMESAVSATTVFFKKDDTIYLKIFGGELDCETATVAVEKFIFSDEVEHDTTVNVDDLKSVLKDFSPLVCAAVNPSEKRIVVEDDGSWANYMFSCITCKNLSGSFDFKSKDIEVIKTFLGMSDDQQIEMMKTKDEVKVKRCQVVGSNFKYSFLVSDIAFSGTLKDNVKAMDNGDGVFVDLVNIYKDVELASDLPHAIGKVGLNYSDMGLRFNLITKKKSENYLTIAGSFEGDVTPLEKDLVVQAKLLRVLLRSFSSKSTVKIGLTEKGITVASDNYVAALLCDAV